MPRKRKEDEITNEQVAAAAGIDLETGQSAKPIESKEARFVRLADRRVSKALRQLDAIANLGNRSQYTYTPAQFERLFDALVTRISAIKAAFTAGAIKSGSGFSVNG